MSGDGAAATSDDTTAKRATVRPLDACLVAFGSHGDVLPFIALGRELRARGHDVTIFANGYHEQLVRRASLEFFEVGTAAEYVEFASHPDVFHPVRGTRRLATLLTRVTEGIYEALAERNVPGRTVTAGSVTSFASRIAREKLGIPSATVTLQPAWCFSVDDPPVLHPRMTWVKSAPRWCRRGVNAFNNYMLERSIGGPVRDFRAKLGLPPWSRLCDWWFSPDAAVGLFPEWFAPRRADWPAHFRHAEFPLFDGVDCELGDEVEAFLSAGPPPIVFTPGSAMAHAEPFMRAAVDACRRLGRRGIILSKLGAQIRGLPADVRQFSYVPLGPLLARSAALVHHGGVGTLSHAMRAGIPQVVTPLAYDQPDNAVRLAALGLARRVNMRGIGGRRLASALDEVLNSEEAAAACRRAAALIPKEPNLATACEAIEELIR